MPIKNNTRFPPGRGPKEAMTDEKETYVIVPASNTSLNSKYRNRYASQFEEDREDDKHMVYAHSPEDLNRGIAVLQKERKPKMEKVEDADRKMLEDLGVKGR